MSTNIYVILETENMGTTTLDIDKLLHENPETFKDKVLDFWFNVKNCLIYKPKEFFRNLNAFFENVWFFRKELWKYRSFDYYYMLDMWVKAAKGLAHSIEHETWVVDNIAMKEATAIKEMIACLRLLQFDGTPPSNNPEDVVKKYYTQQEQMYRQAIDRICEILKGQDRKEITEEISNDEQTSEWNRNYENKYDGTGYRNWWN